jgi:Tfp pilus assembly protein PilN
MLVRARLRQWSLPWGVLALAALVACVVEYRHGLERQAELDALVERCAPLHAMQSETAALAEESQSLRANLDWLQRVQTRDHSLALLGIVGQAVRATAGELQIQRMGVSASAPTSQTAPNAGRPAVAQAPVDRATLTLQGIAGADAALAQFVESLRSSQAFEQVELKSSTHSRTASGDVRQFQIECRYAE